MPEQDDDDRCTVPPGLAHAVADGVSLRSGTRAELAIELREVASAYLLDRSVERYYGLPGQQRLAIKAWSKRGCPGSGSPVVAPEFLVTIEGIAMQLHWVATGKQVPPASLPASRMERAASIFLSV